MNWTKEQREAIEIREKSILVSAAAGSGKTAVLVERIKELIREDKISLDQMLVVTFTNAAASEMREKIVTAIPEQMHQMHRAHISTFHAFALDVIKRYFHLIQIEPNFMICDDPQRILMQNEAMEQLFQKKFQEGDQEFRRFLQLYATSKNEDIPKEMILDVHRFIQSMPDPFGWLEEKMEALRSNEEAFQESVGFQDAQAEIEVEIQSALIACKKVEDWVLERHLTSLIGKAKADVQMLLEFLEGFRDGYDKGTEAIRRSTFARFISSKEDKPEYELIKDDIGLLRDEAKNSIKRITNLYCAKPLKEYVEEMNQTYAEALTLHRLVLEFDGLYRQRKEKKGVIDFSDIEHYALDILNHEAAASEYRNKFHYIFVDEYQDSNLVQESIIERIRRDNNVFMVGDVKQSIYKFRLAEPEIFLKKYEAYKTKGNPREIKLDLNKNFRSKEQIIQLVNHVFGKVMTRRTAGMDYDLDAALYKGVSYKGPLDYPVELHLVDNRNIDDKEIDEEIREMKRAELEASVAATLIKKSKGLPYHDEKTGEERLLQNKDMVILLRSTAGVGEIYQDALEKEGIPAYMDLGDGYFDTIEVLVLLNLLKIIDNRRQDVPLLSILRSPIFGFTVDQLSTIRLQQKRGAYHSAFSFYSQFGADESLRERCQKTIHRIGIWRQKAKFQPLSDFLWELIQDSGYYHYVGALPGGTARQGNLRALVDKAVFYESGQARGLFGFINYIEAMKKGKVSTAPAKLMGESDDVVRIMTVHKSKGLEFPMVLAGNLGRPFHRETGKQISLHKDLGIALKQVDRNQHTWRRTILQNVIDSRKNREDLAEEIRILYVSLTRPMDRLVLLGSVTDRDKFIRTAEMKGELGVTKGNCYLDFLLPAVIGYDGVLREDHDRSSAGTIERSQKEHKSRLQEEMDRGFVVQEDIALEIAKRFEWEYLFPEALQTKSKYSVSELVRKEPILLPTTNSKQTGVDAAKRGTLYHRVMEHLPFHQGSMDINQILGFLDGLVEKEILTAQEAGEIDPTKVEQFFASDIGKRVCRADRIHREVPFNLLKNRNGEEIIIQGIIDCYFEEGDHYILLDYKSNYVTDDSARLDLLAEHYRPQLELYREALEAIRGIKVDETFLYLFSIGKELRIENRPSR